MTKPLSTNYWLWNPSKSLTSMLDWTLSSLGARLLVSCLTILAVLVPELDIEQVTTLAKLLTSAPWFRSVLESQVHEIYQAELLPPASVPRISIPLSVRVLCGPLWTSLGCGSHVGLAPGRELQERLV